MYNLCKNIKSIFIEDGDWTEIDNGNIDAAGISFNNINMIDMNNLDKIISITFIADYEIFLPIADIITKGSIEGIMNISAENFNNQTKLNRTIYFETIKLTKFTIKNSNNMYDQFSNYEIYLDNYYDNNLHKILIDLLNEISSSNYSYDDLTKQDIFNKLNEYDILDNNTGLIVNPKYKTLQNKYNNKLSSYHQKMVDELNDYISNTINELFYDNNLVHPRFGIRL